MKYHKLTPSPTSMRQTTGTTIARIFTVAALRCNHEARDFGWPLASAEMKQKKPSSTKVKLSNLRGQKFIEIGKGAD